MVRCLAAVLAVVVTTPVRADDPSDAPPREAPVAQLRLPGRDMVEVVVRAPFRDGGGQEGSAARLVETIDRALRDRTTLMARQTTETRSVVEAKGDPIAILKAVRSDADVRLLAAENRRIEDHNAERRRAGVAVARLVVIVTLVPQGDKNRVSLVVIDADEGLATLIEDDGRISPEELEGRFRQRAVVATPPPAVVADDDAAMAYVERLFTRELQGQLEAAGVWGKLGTIFLRTNVDDAEILFDGMVVGTTRSGLVELRDVPLGAHTLQVVAAGYEPLERPLTVSAGESEVDATLARAAGLGRVAALGAGIGATVAGGVVLVIAGVTGGEGRLSCTPDCGGSSWLRAGPDAADPVGTGPAMVPLGYSLLGAGAIWLLGPELLERDAEVPWWSIGAGLVVGVLAYSISEFAENPVVVNDR